MMLEWKIDSFALTGLDPLSAEWLRRLPVCASSDDDAARTRLFPAPTGGKEAEADADWREYVEPELRELFNSHVDVVANDLKAMAPGKKPEVAEAAEPEEEHQSAIESEIEPEEGQEIGDGNTLEDEEWEHRDEGGEVGEGEELLVPAAHAHAWMHTLNQARLALGARHNIGEEHMNGNAYPESPEDVFAVLQVEFYGYILHFLLAHCEL